MMGQPGPYHWIWNYCTVTEATVSLYNESLKEFIRLNKKRTNQISYQIKKTANKNNVNFSPPSMYDLYSK